MLRSQSIAELQRRRRRRRHPRNAVPAGGPAASLSQQRSNTAPNPVLQHSVLHLFALTPRVTTTPTRGVVHFGISRSSICDRVPLARTVSGSPLPRNAGMFLFRREAQICGPLFVCCFFLSLTASLVYVGVRGICLPPGLWPSRVCARRLYM